MTMLRQDARDRAVDAHARSTRKILEVAGELAGGLSNVRVPDEGSDKNTSERIER